MNFLQEDQLSFGKPPVNKGEPICITYFGNIEGIVTEDKANRIVDSLKASYGPFLNTTIDQLILIEAFAREQPSHRIKMETLQDLLAPLNYKVRMNLFTHGASMLIYKDNLNVTIIDPQPNSPSDPHLFYATYRNSTIKRDYFVAYFAAHSKITGPMNYDKMKKSHEVRKQLIEIAYTEAKEAEHAFFVCQDLNMEKKWKILKIYILYQAMCPSMANCFSTYKPIYQIELTF
jgi:hypothetical protein